MDLSAKALAPRWSQHIEEAKARGHFSTGAALDAGRSSHCIVGELELREGAAGCDAAIMGIDHGNLVNFRSPWTGPLADEWICEAIRRNDIERVQQMLDYALIVKRSLILAGQN